MHEKQNLVAGQLFPLAILILTAHPQIASLRPSAAAPWFCVDPLVPRRALVALSRADVQNVDISSNLCRLHKVEMRNLDQYRPLIMRSPNLAWRFIALSTLSLHSASLRRAALPPLHPWC